MSNQIEDKIAILRVTVRAALAVMFTMTLCCAVFLIESFQEFLLGSLAGSVSTILVFYFKRADESTGGQNE